MSARLSLCIAARRDELPRLYAAVEDFGHAQNWPDDLLFKVNLALEELGLNVVNHGLDAGTREIDVTLVSEADALTIEISDDGRAFNPLEDAPKPDLDAPLEERPIGGLGVHLVRTMMDEMRYRREHGRNRLTLVKHRDGRGTADGSAA